MKYLMIVVLAALVALPNFAGTASAAGCEFGNKVLSGSVPARKVDEPRSFQINGTALLAVSGAKNGENKFVHLDVTFDGADSCTKRIAPTVGCTVTGTGKVTATIRNPNDDNVTYCWVCMGLEGEGSKNVETEFACNQ